MPLALGSKPKQSQQRKLEKLLANNPVPSVLAASFVHVSRRFLAGRAPANPLEESVFDRLRSLPPDVRSILSCAVGQVDALPHGDRDSLFDATLGGSLDTAIGPKQLADAFASELAQRASLLAFDDPVCVTEVPGKVRVFDPGAGEFFTAQVRIYRINGLRTANYLPFVNIGDYLPSELEQQCVPELVGGEVQVNCTVQKDNCPGNMSAEDNTCFRVVDVEAGQTVMLEGANFFSVDATVELRGREPLTESREVDAHVCGDLDTPVSETINGVSAFINDCRVHDRLTFQVPSDLPPGIYEFDVKVPNITGIANLGAFLVSNREFLRVLVPSTARFRVASETLHAQSETSPAHFGSDEVGIRFLTTGLRADGSLCELQHPDGRVWGRGQRRIAHHDLRVAAA